MPEDLSNAKQQLDELDQLLKQMLEVPDAAAGRGEDATLPAFELPEITRTPPIRRSRETAISLNDFSLTSETATPAVAEPHPLTAVRPAVVPKATLLPEPEFVSVLDRPRRTPLLLMPLAAVDFCFETCTRPFGPVGRWMHGPTGKGLLAVVGFFLLAAAIAVGVLDWLGVTW